MKTIRLGRFHFVVLVVTLLVTLPLTCAIVFQRDLRMVYIERFVAPDMQRHFGYTAEWRTIRGMNLYVVTSVIADGPLAKAGFEAGDIPFEYHGGFQAFHLALQAARDGMPSGIEVMRDADVARGNFSKRVIIVRAPGEGRK